MHVFILNKNDSFAIAFVEQFFFQWVMQFVREYENKRLMSSYNWSKSLLTEPLTEILA